MYMYLNPNNAENDIKELYDLLKLEVCIGLIFTDWHERKIEIEVWI